MKNFYLTTPLYYPNARPHVGSAYTTIVCDVLARYKRMCGYDVAFLTGTDEHGEKLERAAAEAGVSPREFVADKRRLFVELWKKLGIEYTHFVYTDQPDHVTSVQRILRLAQKYEPEVIYKGRYQGRYCVSDERYISDGAEPADCDICGRPAELISEENYFFRLSAFQDRVLQHYEKHPEFVQPDFRRNEVVSFVRSGLRDISVSRQRIKWGIPWPDDPEQVFYVWYDALTGYLTGLGYAEGEQGSADFQKYWRNDASGEVVHMIGKDILRFHAVYWPAFLMAARLPLPKTVFAHGWLYYEQDKMSKSKGNVVYCEPVVEVMGADPLRYYLLRDVPFGQDSSFSYEGLIQRFNSDLANDLGNLASRTLTMLNRYFDGVVPKFVAEAETKTESEHDVQDVGLKIAERVQDHFSRYDFSGGLEGIWRFVSTINRFLTDTQPWVLAEDPSQRDRLGNVLHTAARALRVVAALVCPVMPEAAQKLWQQLGQEGRVEDVRIDQPDWEELPSGTRVTKPEAIFPRLDKEATLAKLHELAEADLERDKPKEKSTIMQTESGKSPEGSPAPSAQPPAPSPERISIEDFAKVDMRVGEVISAERVPGAQKLLKMTVDIGSEVRQVVAGIAEYYEPEKLIGMKVVLVVNLQPRKLRGVESNGMVVAATVGEEGRPVLVTFKEDVPNGSRLK
jgi:methionyl-tRNA synthetase